MSPSLPSFAPFPEAPWRDQIVPQEWEACLSTWVQLAEIYASLSEADLVQQCSEDESAGAFLATLVQEVAPSGSGVLGSSPTASALLRNCFVLAAKLMRLPTPPHALLQWEFLADFSRVYHKKRVTGLIHELFLKSGKNSPEISLQAVKKTLIVDLDAGIKGHLPTVESRLKRLNHLLHGSPDTAAFFLAGSDFLDGLINCYKVMNPPLRKAIITTAYLCLIGLTEGQTPKFSMLADQIYSLKAAADAHKAGPTNANDSMVPELISATPLLKQIQHRLESSGSSSSRIKSVIAGLETYRKPGANVRPKRFVKRKIDKGKGVETDDQIQSEMRVHRMSQISQIQDLFPDLGTGFVSRLLDEYNDDNEQVIAHLLEEDLPPHLATADRSKELSPERTRRASRDIAPRPTPPQIPVRHNVYDDDEFDKLTMDVSNLHFGKRDSNKTADDVLKDRSTAPNKAAILSALAAFDADDDERDDTYDAADVGGAVNDALADDADDQKRNDASEEVLFRTFQANPKIFERDAATRRSEARSKLRDETSMTDEAIEGWAVMLGRSPQQMKQLETKYSGFSGQQRELASTSWRANRDGEDSGQDTSGDGAFRGGARGRGGGPGRGRGGGRGWGGGRGGGNVAGPTGEKQTEQARRRKESNKGSRANHNRRDQRARKMARGGFPGA